MIAVEATYASSFAPGAYPPSFAPGEMITEAGTPIPRGWAFDLNHFVIRLFRGLRTTTTTLVVEDSEFSIAGTADRLEEIKRLATLTDEELARLLGSTRQTLHNWRNGRKISARREQRLMKTLDAIRAINHLMGAQTRQALLEPRKAGLRIFDLFAEGSVQSAHSIALGQPSPVSKVPGELPIGSRMNLIEDRAPISKSKTNKKFSKGL